jgi:hypothetical protein
MQPVALSLPPDPHEFYVTRGVSMRKRKAKLLTPLAVVSAAVLAVSGGLASADGPSTGGGVHLYEADTALPGNLGTVVLTGAITDSGTDCQGCGGKDGLNVLELSKGTFEINVNDLGNKLAALPVNPVTCSSNGSATAPIQIVPNSIHDTGAYSDISGTFYTWGAAALILPRGQNGECDTNATQYPGVLIARGTGTVSFK